jgi:hypothetical protein
MFEEDSHSPIPGFPNVEVHITRFIKEILLRTEVEVAEKKFPFVGRQLSLTWPK